MSKNNNGSIRFRVKIFFFLLLFLVVSIVARLYYVQIFEHNIRLEKAKNLYTTTKTTKGKRGEIFDIRGNLLVGNSPVVSVIVSPIELAELDRPEKTGKKISKEREEAENLRAERNRCKAAYFFAKKFNLSYQEVYNKLNPYRKAVDSDNNVILNEDGTVKITRNRYAPIAYNLSLEEEKLLKDEIKVNKLKGVYYEDSYMRSYPKGELLSNILGLVQHGRDSESAVLGVEKAFNDKMTSSSGKERFEKSLDGRPLAYGELIKEGDATDGCNIYLTVDEAIQSFLEEELDAAYRKWKAKAAYAIIADPKTGNILAIAQRPALDPNSVKSSDINIRLLNDIFEPGSIIKPFTIAKALDDEVVTPETIFDCEKGRWNYLGKPLNDSHPYDKLSVTEIITKSSNIGTAKIALLLGSNRMYDNLRNFGFGQRSGLPLKPEAIGIFPARNTWNSNLALTRIAIGYNIAVTPVQMIRAYCALADNGNLRPLRLVDRIEYPGDGEIRKQPLEAPVQMFRHPMTCHRIVEMMTTVTESGGTARNAKIEGYRVAGKTGTSRKTISGKYSTGKFFSSFVGFAPADQPAFVMLVTIDEPQGGYYGGTVAAPVFREVGRKVLRYMNIDPDMSGTIR